MAYNIITILGPTAAGKTRLAALLADKFNGEIISADSRQVYRRMNIGTGKDYGDYNTGSSVIPYHLIDIADPQEEFNLFLFQKHFYSAFRDITRRGRNPFLAGGTGLYISSIINNYSFTPDKTDRARIDELNNLSIEELRVVLLRINPRLHNKTDIEIKERIIKAICISESRENAEEYELISSLNIGVHYPREIIKQRITERLAQRLKNGMIEEVDSLIKSGVPCGKLAFFGLEYKFLMLYLTGELNYNDMFQKLNSAIHSFAKRQMTWFRKMEKEGTVIHWIDGADFEKASEIIGKQYFNS